jgi:hypothetical protein
MVKTVDLARIRRQISALPMLQREFTFDPRLDRPEAIDRDMQDGVRAEMFGPESGHRLILMIKAVNLARIRRQISALPMLQREFTFDPRLDRPEAIDRDMQDGVRAEMFGDDRGADPIARTMRSEDMLRAHAYCLRAALFGFRAANEIHLRAADEAGNEQVARRPVKIER